MAVIEDKAFWREFILLYKELPELWQVKNEFYKDRDKKNHAYEKLVELMKKKDKNVNKEMVKKKINTLRGCYRRELKKVIQSEKSGAGVGDIYVPSLWYFDEFNFLNDQETAEEESLTRGNNDDSMSSKTHMPSETGNDLNIEIKQSPPSSPENRYPTDIDDNYQNLPATTPSSRMDEYDIFGAFVASELRVVRSNTSLVRSVKRKIQVALLELYETEVINPSKRTVPSAIDISQSMQPEGSYGYDDPDSIFVQKLKQKRIT